MTDERGSTNEMGHPEDQDREVLERTFSRKALIKAGWAVPVAMAVAPAAAFAQSGGGHNDNGLPGPQHIDSHVDVVTPSDRELKRSIETWTGAQAALRAL
jgi:hypothetical protein